MKPVSAIIFEEDPLSKNSELLTTLKANPCIEKVIKVSKDALSVDTLSVVRDLPFGGKSVAKALETARPCPYVLIIPASSGVDISAEEISRFLEIAKECDGGLYYADYYNGKRSPSCIKAVIDYQYGSIRDDFFFGPVQFFSFKHIQESLEEYGQLVETKWAGLYELRLKVSLSGNVLRVPAPLSLVKKEHTGKISHFGYVDPEQLDYQKEMEQVATEHLKRTGAYCSHDLKSVPEDSDIYPVEASVIIPVRNRERTISDAIKSALSQKTDFSFNVLVVQNHSTDRTGEEIEKIAKHDTRVIQIIPEQKDLGIGGCWNLAVNSPQCGRYVCQLDSDDIYEGGDALYTIVETLREGKYGMVSGTYRVVNFNLEEIPPGVVDHREWSDGNGRNNLLRVHGIGAPRAFPTVLLRQYPFPNVSYGEDYAVALRISRDFRVGRIFKPLYLCRRWEENTDADLTHLEANRLAFYKDKLRTEEILERQKINKASDS